MTRAISALLEIMSDTEAPLRRRIEATEGLLGYEAPPEIVEAAKAFLASVFESDEHVDFRLEALKLMRKAEARKITQPTVSATEANANREQWRAVEIARRRMAMAKAGLWPPASNDWASDFRRGDYKAPAGSPMPTDIAESVRLGRERTP